MTPQTPANEMVQPGLHAPGSRRSVTRRGPLLAGVLAMALLASAAPPPTVTATTTWSRNLWVPSAFVYQDPYFTACTAAATMFMLNVIAYRQTGGAGFTWTPTRVRNSADPANTSDMTSILAFERANDTLRPGGLGTDAHGWRNALNAYGWSQNTMTDPASMVFEDRSYRTFSGAVRAAVRAIARRGMPVGVLGWAGGHAQVMTGYVVTGADPRVSNNFTVVSVYLSDPLRRNRVVNRRVSWASLRSGSLTYRFQAYRDTSSPYDDPLKDGTMAGAIRPASGPSEWYRRWVLVLPVRSGPAGPEATPDVTPEPSLSAAPEPTTMPSPEPAPAAVPAPTVAPTPVATPEPTLAPAPEATPERTPDVTPEPTLAPTPEVTPDVTPLGISDPAP